MHVRHDLSSLNYTRVHLTMSVGKKVSQMLAGDFFYWISINMKTDIRKIKVRT